MNTTPQEKFIAAKDAAIRDTVIRNLVPQEQIAYVKQSVYGLELALMSSEPGNVFKVTYEGTEILNIYLKYLEREICKLKGLIPVSDTEIKFDIIEEECKFCNGMKYVKATGAGKYQSKKCPVCKGTGIIKHAIQKESDDVGTDDKNSN